MAATETQELRGFILTTCRVNYPQGCSEELIFRTVAGMGFAASPAEIRGHIEYLREKGYVRVEELRHGAISRVVVYITPKGIDLLEGSIPEDPGILAPL